MNTKLLIYLKCIFLIALIACKDENEGQTIRILNSCINTNQKNITINQQLIIKNCGDGPSAIIEVNGIDEPKFERKFILESKNDSASVVFTQSGKFEAKIRSTGFQVGDYSDWARDTIYVSE